MPHLQIKQLLKSLVKKKKISSDRDKKHTVPRRSSRLDVSTPQMLRIPLFPSPAHRFSQGRILTPADPLLSPPLSLPPS